MRTSVGHLTRNILIKKANTWGCRLLTTQYTDSKNVVSYG